MIEITNNVELKDNAKNNYNNITGSDVMITIIDSGVNYLHPDLISNVKLKCYGIKKEV
ncbi:hypothetical protein [Metaclostridioides mangenotii]|uniref:hypothetical protein n=1 Tax=Metaclostridioides mangenotii TaxID=1540 RepID=UPI000A629AE0|nr:hypothetical protein [Clostridioides mangenotii]